MKITIEPTADLIEIAGTKCRIWRGTTDTGREIDAIVQSVRVKAGASDAEHQALGVELRSAAENIIEDRSQFSTVLDGDW